jgi:hypothetical protein
MSKSIAGIDIQKNDDYIVCIINELSDALKNIIRKNLQVYCHGNKIANSPLAQLNLYSYKATISSFIERYQTKTKETQIGMIGEFLTHILIGQLLDTFEIASAFFNLEEKSIKKGYDLIVYDTSKGEMWITEVKSGELHKNKNSDQTTKDLLYTAKDDLKKRLNEQDIQLWYNAINHVLCVVQETKDYKNSLIEILAGNHGSKAASHEASSDDKNVILVSSVFSKTSDKITVKPALSTIDNNKKTNLFANVIVLSIQKNTYQKVFQFLESEMA